MSKSSTARRGADAVSLPKPSTKQKLIDAAHALIWANSYAHVSVDEICRHAGVQKGSFYHFFPTKHDLAAAAMEQHWREATQKLDGLFAAHLSAEAQLKALCREMLAKQQRAREETGMVCGCPYATVGSELSGQHESLSKLSTAMSESFSGYFEKMLQQAAAEGLIEKRNLKTRAREMHVYAIGAMLQSRLLNSLDPVGPSLEKALRRISGLEA
jgi:TetR/AcrR family transcriptional repressor of nem operon